MTDIVERLRERHWRSAAESNDEAKERRQRERNEAADEIERLREWNREIALNAREFVAENEKLRAALERARTVLGNMALENAGRTTFWRWPIHHEPLRADARNLLPIIDAALEGPRDRMAKPLEGK